MALLHHLFFRKFEKNETIRSMLTHVATASKALTAQSIYAVAFHAESERLENKRKIISQDDLLNGLYTELLIKKEQLPVFNYEKTPEADFAINLRIAPLRKYLKARNLSGTAELIKNIAEEISHLPITSFDSVLQILLNRARDNKSKELVYNHFERATAEAKKRYIINPQDIRELIKLEIDNCLLLKVHSQKILGGGGRASCGYHALKNGLIIYDSIQALPHERLPHLRLLEDKYIIQTRFAGVNSLWRKEVLEHRVKQLIEDFVYDVLLSSLTGEKTITTRSFNQTIPNGAHRLRLENNYITFAPFQAENRLTNEIRDEFIRAIAVAAKAISREIVIDRFPVTFEINGSQIINQVMLALDQVNSNRLSTDEFVVRYIPTIRDMRISWVNGILQEVTSQKTKSNEFLKAKMIEGPEGLSSTLGDWLNQSEMQLIKKYESNYQSEIFKASKNSDLIFIENIEELLQGSTNIQTDDLVKLKNELAQEEGNLTKIILLNNAGHWLTCVVNKQGKSIQFIFADSLDNSWDLKSDLNRQLIRYLQGKDLVVPQEAPKENESENVRRIIPQIGINSPLSHIRSTDLPTLASIFNDKVPNSLLKILRALPNLDNWKNTYREIAAIKPIMLHGPPGTGKTTAVEIIARKLDRELIYVSGSAFGDEYKNSEQSYLKKFFEEEIVKSGQKVIVFIDEIDALARTATNQAQEGAVQRCNAFMNHLDKIAKNENIFIFAATNNPDVLAPAVRNRFDMIKVDLPDYRTREAFIGNFVNQGIDILNKPERPHFSVEMCQNLGVLTKGFSIRDLQTFIINALVNYNEGFPIEQPHRIQDTYNARVFQLQSPLDCAISTIGILGIATAVYLMDKRRSLFDQHLYSSFCKQRKQVEINGPGSRNSNLGGAFVIGSCIGAGIGGLVAGPLGAVGGAKAAVYGSGIGATALYGGMKLYLDGNLS